MRIWKYRMTIYTPMHAMGLKVKHPFSVAAQVVRKESEVCFVQAASLNTQNMSSNELAQLDQKILNELKCFFSAEQIQQRDQTHFGRPENAEKAELQKMRVKEHLFV